MASHKLIYKITVLLFIIVISSVNVGGEYCQRKTESSYYKDDSNQNECPGPYDNPTLSYCCDGGRNGTQYCCSYWDFWSIEEPTKYDTSSTTKWMIVIIFGVFLIMGVCVFFWACFTHLGKRKYTPSATTQSSPVRCLSPRSTNQSINTTFNNDVLPPSYSSLNLAQTPSIPEESPPQYVP